MATQVEDPTPPLTAVDVRERIARIYVSVSPGGRVPADDESGDLDSMAFLEFIVGVEREFGVAIDVEELDETNFATTAATTAFILRKILGGDP